MFNHGLNVFCPFIPKNEFVVAAVCITEATKKNPGPTVSSIVISYSLFAAVHETVPASTIKLSGKPPLSEYKPNLTTAVPLKELKVRMFNLSKVVETGTNNGVKASSSKIAVLPTIATGVL